MSSSSMCSVGYQDRFPEASGVYLVFRGYAIWLLGVTRNFNLISVIEYC